MVYKKENLINKDVFLKGVPFENIEEVITTRCKPGGDGIVLPDDE